MNTAKDLGVYDSTDVKNKEEFSEEFSVESARARATPVAMGAPTSLDGVLQDLATLELKAQESRFALPPEDLKEKAIALLRTLPRHPGLVLQAYPMSQGEIVLSVSSEDVKGSVLLTFHPEGAAWCNVRINGRPRRAWYPDTRDWPDGFIREALAEVAGSRVITLFWRSRVWSELLHEQRQVRETLDEDHHELLIEPPSE